MVDRSDDHRWSATLLIRSWPDAPARVFTVSITKRTEGLPASGGCGPRAAPTGVNSSKNTVRLRSTVSTYTECCQRSTGDSPTPFRTAHSVWFRSTLDAWLHAAHRAWFRPAQSPRLVAAHVDRVAHDPGRLSRPARCADLDAIDAGPVRRRYHEVGLVMSGRQHAA